MKLNETSYCHKQIRSLCAELEESLEMKLFTNLSEEFNEIKFFNSLGYVVINYKKQAVFSLGHKLSKEEFDKVKDIILLCDWLEIGLIYAKRRSSREKRRALRKGGRKNEQK